MTHEKTRKGLRQDSAVTCFLKGKKLRAPIFRDTSSYSTRGNNSVVSRMDFSSLSNEASRMANELQKKFDLVDSGNRIIPTATGGNNIF